MQPEKFKKAAIFTLVVVFGFIVGWELYWRQKGFIATYNDDKVLWANQRKEIYKPLDEATVFIGSSRIKYDLDIPTWQKLTGEKAIQLALVGTSPRLLLQDLANDEKFKGKLVVDVTEILFFSQNPVFNKSSKESIAYYNDQTPSENLSSRIGFGLESRLAFLEELNFSLTALLNDLEIPNRPGVFAFPVFPKGFGWTNLNRQTYMSPGFLADNNTINRQTDIWKILLMSDPTPQPTGSQLQAIFSEVRAAIEKIESRGGRVIFVRTPSNGPLAEAEEKLCPRIGYWNELIRATGSRGIHFADYPQTANMICPEWSHLSPVDAINYTQHLVEIFREVNWFSSR